MKAIITAALMLLSVGAAAQKSASEKDTVGISQGAITRFISDETVTKSGKKTTKYYALIRNELVPTSKTVVEKVALCKKYNAKCALAVVRNRKTKSYLRIILN